MFGITIDGHHTQQEYGLKMISTNNATPKSKQYTISLTGADGELNITPLFGAVKYDNYIQTFIFDKFIDIYEYEGFVSVLKNTFEGKTCSVELDNDTDFYRVGVCSVVGKYNGTTKATITLSFDFEPYKMKKDLTVITTSTTSETTEILHNSKKSVIPTFYTDDGGLSVSINNSPFYGLLTGGHRIRDIFLKEGENELVLRGNGSVRIEYREGVL